MFVARFGAQCPEMDGDFQGLVSRVLPSAIAVERRIFIVNNSLDGSFNLPEQFRTMGYSVTASGGVTEELLNGGVSDYDLIVIDVRPDVIGCQVARRLRLAGQNAPILLVSARSNRSALDAARAAGADAVVVLPVGNDALQAKLGEIFATAASQAPHPVRAGSIQVEAADHVLVSEGGKVSLAPDEYCVLAALAEQPGVAVSNGMIDTLLRRSASTSRHGATDRIVGELNRKLVDVRSNAVISAARGAGYILRTVELACA